MIKPLLKYPDQKIRLISATVRHFDDTLKNYITDMIDTMKHNNLDALSAILIGLQYNIIVLKEDGEYKPYINTRYIKHSGTQTLTQRSLYYDGISVDVDRYEKITIVYEDENENQHFREVEGELAALFQQQMDYCSGSTFVDRVDKELKERINEHLEFGLVEEAGSCPMVFYRDYFKRAAKLLMVLVFVSFISHFFTQDTRESVFTLDKIALSIVPLLLVSYFFYALYESRKYKQCTSCQIGNIIGTVVIYTFWLIVVSAGAFWLVKV